MSTMQTKQGLKWLVIAAAAAVVMQASIVSAAGVSPFSTAVLALPGLDMYSQFDQLDIDLDVAGAGCCVGYKNTVGGWLLPSGGGSFVPGDATSGPGAPLVGVVGDVNLSKQNRPGSGPAAAATGTLYTSSVFGPAQHGLGDSDLRRRLGQDEWPGPYNQPGGHGARSNTGCRDRHGPR